MWNPPPEKNEEYVALVKYIIYAMPTALEHKSTQGFTPLHLAVTVRRPEIVELLISAGANQRVCDRHGRNILHNMLVPLVASDLAWHSTMSLFSPVRLRELFQLLDRSHIKEMLLERCTLGPHFSSLTPQAYWLKKNTSTHGRTSHMKPDVIKILTEYSGGEDMDLINGEGDLPLHQVSFPMKHPDFCNSELIIHP
jgi:ankyrin repeat protein